MQYWQFDFAVIFALPVDGRNRPSASEPEVKWSGGQACITWIGWARHLSADDHNRARGVLGALGADRTQQQPGEAAAASRTDDQA